MVLKMPTKDLHPTAQRIQNAIDNYNLNKDPKQAKITWTSLCRQVAVTPQSATNWKKGIISKSALELVAKALKVEFLSLYLNPSESVEDYYSVGFTYIEYLKQQKKYQALLAELNTAIQNNSPTPNQQTMETLNKVQSELTLTQSMMLSLFNDLTKISEQICNMEDEHLPSQ